MASNSLGNAGLGNATAKAGEELRSAASKAGDDLRKGVSEIGASVQAASGDIAADLRMLKEDIARLTETVASIASNRGQQAASRVTDGLRGVTEGVSETASSAYAASAEIASAAKTHAKSFAGDVEDTVRRNPLGTVLAALGLGMLVGMMSRSR